MSRTTFIIAFADSDKHIVRVAKLTNCRVGYHRVFTKSVLECGAAARALVFSAKGRIIARFGISEWFGVYALDIPKFSISPARWSDLLSRAKCIDCSDVRGSFSALPSGYCSQRPSTSCARQSYYNNRIFLR